MIVSGNLKNEEDQDLSTHEWIKNIKRNVSGRNFFKTKNKRNGRISSKSEIMIALKKKF